MKANNIICFETEWLYNNVEKRNRFNLKTESLLNCLKEFYGCEIIYRQILHLEDLEYYLDYFNKRSSFVKNFPIIYIATHGDRGSIHFENDVNLDLSDLALMAKGFFKGKVVHFSSCKTLANPVKTRDFKNETGASLVSGYTKSIDAMQSAIADLALFNAIAYTKRFGIIANESQSKFRKIYKSILDELGFEAY